MMPEYWWLDWRDECCVIVASGPSATAQPVDLAKDVTRCIAINESWKLAPFANLLYACDWAWWKANDGCRKFAGLRASIDGKACGVEGWNVKKVDCQKGDDRICLDAIGHVGWGGNSGYHALQLAIQFGCKKIALVGYDMNITKGAHWHGKHGACLNNPTAGNAGRWRRVIDSAARKIEAHGVEVVNCSPTSMLLNYPKDGLEETLVRWGCLA